MTDDNRNISYHSDTSNPRPRDDRHRKRIKHVLKANEKKQRYQQNEFLLAMVDFAIRRSAGIHLRLTTLGHAKEVMDEWLSSLWLVSIERTASRSERHLR